MRPSILVLCVSVGWCVACSGLGGSGGEPVTTTDKLAIQQGEDGELTVTNGQGGVASVGANTKLPEDLPVTLPPGAWVPQMVISTPEGTMVTVTPPADAADLDLYFKSELVRLGCPSPNYAAMPGLAAWQCAGIPGFDQLAVNFLGDGAERSIQIVYKRSSAPADAQ